MAQSHQVNPAAAAFATCYGTIFMSAVAHCLAVGRKEFVGERTCTHACAICFKDAINIANVARSHAQTHTGTGRYGVRAGNKGVGAEVHIEHCALGTFGKHLFALTQGVVNQPVGICEQKTLERLGRLKP